jgi:hypothetical protein
MNEININQVREELCDVLDLPLGSGHDSISSKLVTDQERSERELIFFEECIELYSLPQGASWVDISDAYYSNIKDRLNELSSDSERRNFLTSELKRFQLAKLLQINKFTASTQEIAQNFLELGINIEA